MLTIDNILIEREKVTKFLGVLIDENMNWKNHIDYITNKVSKNIGILYQARDYISKSNLKQLYFAFVQSCISYGIIAWGSVSKSNLETLFRRQKHAIRAINFKEKLSPSGPLFLDIKALNIYKLNLYSMLCLVYKSFYKTCPKAFEKPATPKSAGKYTLRSEGVLFGPKCKTNFSQFSVDYREPHLWE